MPNVNESTSIINRLCDYLATLPFWAQFSVILFLLFILLIFVIVKYYKYPINVSKIFSISDLFSNRRIQNFLLLSTKETLSDNLRAVYKYEYEILSRIQLTKIADREVTNYLIEMSQVLNNTVPFSFYRRFLPCLMIDENNILKVKQGWLLKINNCIGCTLFLLSYLVTGISAYLLIFGGNELKFKIIYSSGLIISFTLAMFFLTLIIPKVSIKRLDTIVKMYLDRKIDN